MTKVNVVLSVALVLSSLYLVKTSHEARQHFSAIDRARTEKALLDADFQRLEAERQQQATALNVERKAKERLNMRKINPAVTQYVVDEGESTTPAVTQAVKPAPQASTAAAATSKAPSP